MEKATVLEETELPDPQQRAERLAAWLQFPRRVVLLLLAFGAAWGFITGLREILAASSGALLPEGAELDWAYSLATQRPVAEIITEQLPNTLLLVGAALFLAALLALVLILVALLVHSLEQRTGALGSILKGLGRLTVFTGGAAPTFCVAIFLLYVFVIQMRWLPIGGMFDLGGTGGLGERLTHLILPTVALALLPAMLTAQTVAREVTLPRPENGAGCRLWLQGLFKGLGTLLGQIGGLLGAGVLVEIVFNWPGVGRTTINAMVWLDLPLLIGGLNAYAVVILIGRLAAELFRWLERLVRVPSISPPPDPTPWRAKARRAWVILALLLLLAPLGLAVAGITTPEDAAIETDVGSVNQPPSSEHPWGTDRLGRDVQARVLRGGLATLGAATGIAVMAVFLGGAGGAVTGLLAARRALWSESLADLLLLPADVLLFLPAVGLAATLTLPLSTQRTPAMVGATVAIALLPRCVRFYQSLWLGAPEQRKGLMLGVVGLGALFLGSLLGGFALVSALDFLGLGAPPPFASLGRIAQESIMMLRAGSTAAIRAMQVLCACALALYTATDALIGFFRTKDVIARLNE